MKKILLNFAAENTTNSHSIQQTAGVVAFLYTRSMTYYKQDKLLHPPPRSEIYISFTPYTHPEVYGLERLNPAAEKRCPLSVL